MFGLGLLLIATAVVILGFSYLYEEVTEREMPGWAVVLAVAALGKLIVGVALMLISLAFVTWVHLP